MVGIFLFLYNEIFFRPLTNTLVWLTGVVPGGNLGIAVVLLTLIVRALLFPFSHRMTLTQIAMRRIEPELSRIKKEYKDRKEDQARAMMELYRKHGISPFSGFIFLIIQLPLLIAMYRVFLVEFSADTLSGALYNFVTFPATISLYFLGANLAEPSMVFAALAGISQFFQVRLAMQRTPTERDNKKNNQTQKSFGSEFQRAMKTQMQYVFPFIIFFIGLQFSAALTLYWTVMNIFAIVHEAIVHHRANKAYDGKITTNQPIAP